MLRFLVVLVGALCAGSAFVCAQAIDPAQSVPVQPGVPLPQTIVIPQSADAAQQSVSVLPQTATAVPQRTAPVLLTAPTTYRLQPGDSFALVYRRTPEYNQIVSVQPDGTVTLQLLGSFRVRGLTVTEAQSLIERAASQRLLHPEVSLELRDWEKPHFTVLGEVGTPGRFELRGPLTVEDGVAMAGGLKLSARHTKIVLIHRVNDTVGETQLVDFARLEHSQKPGMELLALRPGDIVVVPMSTLTKVERYVNVTHIGVGTYLPIF